MARDIINEDSKKSNMQAVLSYGWDLGPGKTDKEDRPLALLEVNDHGLNCATVALEWGDLARLNKSVRKAMKHYQRQIKK